MISKFRIQYKILPILFIIILGLPMLNKHTNLIKKTEVNDNRNLAEIPKFKLEKLDPFPADYEKYYNDHFEFRGKYLKLNGFLNFKMLHVSANEKKVVIGKDGWLFKNNEFLPRKTANSGFSKVQSQKLKDEIAYRIKYYQEHGAHYYMVIIPVKATVYPEKVPSAYAVNNQELVKNRTELFMEFIKGSNIDDKVIYLQDSLVAKKSINKLFLEKDNHWNQLGALYAGDIILNTISKKVQIPNYCKEKFYDVKYEKIEEANLANIIGINGLFSEKKPILQSKQSNISLKKEKNKGYKVPPNFPYPWLYEFRYSTSDASSLKALIYRDSFTTRFMEQFARSFKESVFIWDSWKYQINDEITKSEKPDIVFDIIVETGLNSVIENAPNRTKN